MKITKIKAFALEDIVPLDAKFLSTIQLRGEGEEGIVLHYFLVEEHQ